MSPLCTETKAKTNGSGSDIKSGDHFPLLWVVCVYLILSCCVFCSKPVTCRPCVTLKGLFSSGKTFLVMIRLISVQMFHPCRWAWLRKLSSALRRLTQSLAVIWILGYFLQQTILSWVDGKYNFHYTSLKTHKADSGHSKVAALASFMRPTLKLIAVGAENSTLNHWIV